jgi:hypothetical protein
MKRLKLKKLSTLTITSHTIMLMTMFVSKNRKKVVTAQKRAASTKRDAFPSKLRKTQRPIT